MRDFAKDPKECACRDWAYTVRHTYTPGAHHPTCPMSHDGRVCICHWCRRLRGEDQMPQMISATPVKGAGIFHLTSDQLKEAGGELLKYDFKPDWDKK